MASVETNSDVGPRDDLDETWLAIAPDNMPAAERIIDELDDLLKKLLDFPEMGVGCADILPEVCSFPLGNYVVFYRPMPYGIAVLRIVYGGRDLHTLEFPPQ